MDTCGDRLLRLLRSDPSEGMRLVIDKYSGLVYTIMKNHLGSMADARDLEEYTADVFSEFYEKRADIDRACGGVAAFISTLAKRRAIDIYRRSMRMNGRFSPIGDDAYRLAADAESQPESAVLAESERKMLLMAIRSLDETDRDIIFRRYFLMQQVTEIAEQMGMKQPAVSKRISRALAKLRVIMEENYE